MAYASLSDLRTYLAIAAADTGDDTLLTALIARAQKLIDGYCGWGFEASASATRYYNPLTDVDEHDVHVLHLDEPLLTLTTLTNGDADVITAAEYYLEPTNTVPKWAVRLRSSTGLYWTYTTDPEQAISIAGTWGYMAAADVAIQQATIRWAGYLYRQRDSQVFDVTAQPGIGLLTIPQGMPKDVERMLASYRRLC